VELLQEQQAVWQLVVFVLWDFDCPVLEQQDCQW
jgi:hypothetical protein